MKATIRHDILAAGGFRRVTQHVLLDEVVIPGRVHIEAMGDDVWHVALGDGAVTLSVSARGVTVVEVAAHADEALRVLEDLGPLALRGLEG